MPKTSIEDLEKENLRLRDDIYNLRRVLKEAIKYIENKEQPPYCLGCGREPDEEHKADCVIYKK